MPRLLALPLLVAGVLTGWAAVLLHARWWGLALGLAACAATLVALPPRWWGRLAFAVGWVVAVALGAAGRPEGDFLVAADAAGWTLLVSTLVVLVGSLVTIGRRRPAPTAGQGGRPAPT